MISVITPTADRPVAFALCESMMARQTLRPDEWIVADGGQEPTHCTMGQTHFYDKRPAGALNFSHNLLNGIACAKGEIIVVVEDDDFYRPEHIETLVKALKSNPQAMLAGDGVQRYYNVARRCWRTFINVGSSMCQTAMRREALPKLKEAIQKCAYKSSYGIDATLWRSVPRQQWVMTQPTVVGIKGLPGQVGLGIGHRPDSRWIADPNLTKLRSWIGDDVETYRGFAELAAA